MDSTEPRIAIIGAGIAGLTLSRAVDVFGSGSAQKPRIDIYEAAANVSEIGAGINIWPRTWETMKALGLSDMLTQFLPYIPDEQPRLVFEIRKADEKKGYQILDYISPGGTIRLHRKALQQVLLSFQPTGRVHLSHKLTSYEETDDEVLLHFADGSNATCDLLIGADGIRSSVRRRFIEAQKSDKSMNNPLPDGLRTGDAVWTGSYAYRGLVPFGKLDSRLPGHRALTTPLMYAGKIRHIICYPLPYNDAVNVIAVSTDLTKEGSTHPLPTNMPCDKEEVRALFNNWDPEVQTLVECMENPSKWALMSLVPLEHYARGRVLLAGDAAHGMTPHQGAGAGQAFDDAYVLGALLAHPLSSSVNIPRIAEIYDRVRCPVGNRVLRQAREAGFTAELIGPAFESVGDGRSDGENQEQENVRSTLHREFEGMIQDWEWVWSTSAEEDRRQAVSLLDSLLAA